MKLRKSQLKKKGVEKTENVVAQQVIDDRNGIKTMKGPKQLF